MGNSSTLHPSFKYNSFYCYSPEDIIKIAPLTVLCLVCVVNELSHYIAIPETITGMFAFNAPRNVMPGVRNAVVRPNMETVRKQI
jgi:hypothetical protein